jgi:hypothetical protein
MPALGLFCFSYYLIAGFGINLGYHRASSHKALQLPKWMERLAITLGLPAGTPARARHHYPAAAGEDGHTRCLHLLVAAAPASRMVAAYFRTPRSQLSDLETLPHGQCNSRFHCEKCTGNDRAAASIAPRQSGTTARCTNSLQLDETIAIYVARILEQPHNLVLLNNKHPLVPESTLRAGHRLVLHGLASEMLYELLVRVKRARNTRAGA